MATFEPPMITQLVGSTASPGSISAEKSYTPYLRTLLPQGVPGCPGSANNPPISGGK